MSSVKKWIVLFITTINLSLIFLNSAAVPIALPTLEKEFLFPDLSVIWVVNVYILSLIASLLLGGKLSDIHGKKWLFIFGFSLFGMGSLLSAISMNKWFLIGARIIQGAGAGLSMPSTGSLLISHFPINERGKAIGINTSISSIFLIAGAPIGGLLTGYLSWRYIFWINVPLCLLGIYLTHKILDKEKRKEEKVGWLEVFLLSGAIIFLVVALMEGTRLGWDSFYIFSFFIFSLIFLILFIFHFRKKEELSIPFLLFKNKGFRSGTLSISITQLLVMVTVIWSLYFQEVLNYSPTKTGMLLFVATSPVIFTAPIAGYLADKFSPKTPMLIGFFMLFFAFGWFLFFRNGSFFHLIPGLIAFGLGIPSIFSPGFTMAMNQVADAKLGSATGLIMISRQLFSTIGLGIMTALYQTFYGKVSSQAAFSSVLIFGLFFALIGLLILWPTFVPQKHNR